MHLKLKYNDVNNVNVLFAAAMSFYIVLLGVNSLFNTFAYGTSIDSMIVFGLYAIIILFSIVPILSNVNGNHWLIFIGFLFVAFFGLLLGSVGAKKLITSILSYFSFFLVGAALQDNDRLERYIRISSVIATIFGGFYAAFSLLVPGQYLHDMTAAYSLLPAAIMAVYFALSRRNFLYYIVFVASLFELLVMGVRGPMLIYTIALAIILFRYMEKGYQKVLLVVIAALIVYYIASERYVILLNSINNYLSSFGMTNSIVKSLIRKTFFDDDGRAEITDIILREINASPILGHGIFYDRIILNGGYTHNILTEMLVDYGYVFGIAGFIIVIWRAIVLIRKTKGNSFRFCLVIMIISLSLGQNMFSGSYLENEFFFLLLGMSFNHKLWNTNKKSHNRDINTYNWNNCILE